MSDQISNQKLVATLRRIADQIEKSPTLHCWKASAAGGEPVCVDMCPLEEQPAVMYGPMNYALFIGGPGFVDAAPSVDDVMSPPVAKKLKGKK